MKPKPANQVSQSEKRAAAALRLTPAWILDEWITLRQEYLEVLESQDFMDDDAHIARCDEALADYDRASAKLNKLFKYPKR